jgi:hypothetical protein
MAYLSWASGMAEGCCGGTDAMIRGTAAGVATAEAVEEKTALLDMSV